MKKLVLFSIILMSAGFAQAEDCYILKSQLRDAEFRKIDDQRQIWQITQDINSLQTQVFDLERQLNGEISRLISSASMVSTECHSNISGGFSNPTSQSVAACVNSEVANSGIVCRDRGPNDPYCLEKRACLDVAQNGRNIFASHNRSRSLLSNRQKTLRSHQYIFESDIRELDSQISDLRYRLQYCTNL
jgi:hypothetical protein